MKIIAVGLILGDEGRVVVRPRRNPERGLVDRGRASFDRLHDARLECDRPLVEGPADPDRAGQGGILADAGDPPRAAVELPPVRVPEVDREPHL